MHLQAYCARTHSHGRKHTHMSKRKRARARTHIQNPLSHSLPGADSIKHLDMLPNVLVEEQKARQRERMRIKHVLVGVLAEARVGHLLHDAKQRAHHQRHQQHADAHAPSLGRNRIRIRNKFKLHYNLNIATKYRI